MCINNTHRCCEGLWSTWSGGGGGGHSNRIRRFTEDVFIELHVTLFHVPRIATTILYIFFIFCLLFSFFGPFSFKWYLLRRAQTVATFIRVLFAPLHDRIYCILILIFVSRSDFNNLFSVDRSKVCLNDVPRSIFIVLLCGRLYRRTQVTGFIPTKKKSRMRGTRANGWKSNAREWWTMNIREYRMQEKVFFFILWFRFGMRYKWNKMDVFEHHHHHHHLQWTTSLFVYSLCV